MSATRALKGISLSGIVRAIAGAIFAVSALVMLYVSFPEMTQREFSLYGIATFLAALAADFLVGDDIRRHWNA